MVAERRTKRQITVNQRGNNLIDELVGLVGRDPFAGNEIAVEEYKFWTLIVEDGVHDANSLEICILSISQKIGCRIVSDC